MLRLERILSQKYHLVLIYEGGMCVEEDRSIRLLVRREHRRHG